MASGLAGERPPDVLLCVTGGVAAYRACELVRLLVRRGLAVQVAMTPTAMRFVGETTFAALSRRTVLADRDQVTRPIYPHLDAARDAHLVVVAPATANTIAKLAAGLADNVVTESVLAASGALVVAPAMNVRMWEHPATRGAVATLRGRGAIVVGPASGELAEGEVGAGRLAAPEEIAAAVDTILGITASPLGPEPSLLAGRRVLVTAGGTREPLDPVRFIGNRSSGRMGVAIADAAAARGAEVVTILGTASVVPSAGRTLRIETAAELAAALDEEAPAADVVVMAAAVADYKPRQVAAEKRRRSDAWHLDLEPTPDLLEGLACRRAAAPGPRQVLVGFAAETSDAEAGAQAKLHRKGVDLIVANDVSEPGIGFDSDENEVILVTKNDSTPVPRASKRAIAGAILDRIETLLA